jgi:N-acetylneuraminic acid mutarotase
VNQGATQTFTASVTGTTNTAVTWGVQEGAAGGSITTAGIYTAPAGAGTFHVVATSQAENTARSMAVVSVPSVSVAVTPQMTVVTLSGTQSFMANVTGTINSTVTWSIQEGATGGMIDANGNYTAPSSLGTFHVLATSSADVSAIGIATVTVVQSKFTPTGSMGTPRVNHTATLLVNGKVLVTGGFVGASTRSSIAVSAEVFDPSTGNFSSTADMETVRASHTGALLSDGRVLIAGGLALAPDGDDCATLSSAELFDPASGTFSPTGNMTASRFGHTATTLKDGKVLIAGGVDISEDSENACTGQLIYASAELYDPATGNFTPTGSMSDVRFGATATLLPDGKVLITGGFSDGGFQQLITLWRAEIYDPATGTFALTGRMSNPRTEHTATLLQNGQVLIAGGVDEEPSVPGEVFASAELYDPATGTFTTSAQTASMSTPRSQHAAALLPSGKVLITGGGNSSGVLSSSELFNPVTDTLSLTVSMAAKRAGHTATLLQDGRVLITGGSAGSGSVLASAELYQQ